MGRICDRIQWSQATELSTYSPATYGFLWLILYMESRFLHFLFKEILIGDILKLDLSA